MDVVVTVPKRFGLDRWIAEGDPAGSPWSGQAWHFYLGGVLPRIQPGERVYVVYNGALRGYAPLIRIDVEGWQYGLVRHGAAVAVSLAEYIPGFRGFRYRWWERALEQPFADWQDRQAALFDRAALMHRPFLGHSRQSTNPSGSWDVVGSATGKRHHRLTETGHQVRREATHGS